MNLVSRSGIIVLCLAGFAVSASASEVLEIEPRSGVSLRMLVDLPANAKALAMLFPGGAGKVRIQSDATIRGTKGNFLTRSRHLFVANGIATALMDAPSDHIGGKGLTFDYRMTGTHADEIKQAIAKLRERYPGLSIWLVGTSRGSTSTANAASTLKSNGPDGLVLTASVGRSSKHGGNVLDFDLEDIRVPALVVHHRDDGCGITPFSGAKRIKARLTGARPSELMAFEGDDSGSGKACGGTSHHGFLGIEQKVVDAISAWIKRH